MVADKLKQPKGATDAPHMTARAGQSADTAFHDIESRGKAIYEEKIRHNVDDTHRGKFAVIDVDSGDYEIDSDLVAALDRLDGRRPGDIALHNADRPSGGFQDAAEGQGAHIMITGRVAENLDPVVAIEISDSSGVFQSLEFVVDTGFQGFLALPSDIILELGLIPRGLTSYIPATGVETRTLVYTVTVSWHGRQRSAPVIESEDALLGMALLLGSKLTVDARIGGEVVIEENPA